MSATFRLAKKKFTQNDLRKLMNEKRTKTVTETKKIESALAKYSDSGQLMCVLCNSIVRSEDVWKVHINAKQHKQNLVIVKELKEKTINSSTSAGKRPAATPTDIEDVPVKKLKSILKNSPLSAEAAEVNNSKILPEDFFDGKQSSSNFFETTLRKTSIKQGLVNIKRGDANNDGIMDVDAEIDKDDTLPEGFFDDPIKDAKARNSEYKDPIEEEWERFQKEIKDAADISNAIIAEEQEEATADRQIDEIDEQMRNWSRVLELEKKKKSVILKDKFQIHKLESMDVTELSDVDSDFENDEFDEFLDWRAKRL